VFHPAPNVESALIVMRRHAPAPAPELAALVHGAFAHRRKALAGSLALVPGAPQDIRVATRAALERIGQPADARAERLPPADWSRLADEIGRDRLADLRPR
jgi:16S rRNA (adenine1518-N6/adenine1519-N6)-dimethyltransferase